MTELVIYAALLIAVIGHSIASAKMYRVINSDQKLSFREKNDWKLKALVFPAFFWKQYQKEKNRKN
jgi:hypothetical protein